MKNSTHSHYSKFEDNVITNCVNKYKNRGKAFQVAANKLGRSVNGIQFRYYTTIKPRVVAADNRKIDLGKFKAVKHIKPVKPAKAPKAKVEKPVQAKV